MAITNYCFVDPEPALTAGQFGILPDATRLSVYVRAHRLNAETIERTRRELGADWVLIAGSELVDHGPSYRMPDDADVRDVEARYNKPAFMFFD